MSAAEVWLTVAAIVAGVAALLHLAGPPPPVPARLAHALHAAALALVAVALVIALP
jgi:hypothetical protein